MEHGTQGLGAKDLERVLCGATPAVIKKTRTACVTPSVMTISLLHTTPVHSRKSVDRLSATIQSYMGSQLLLMYVHLSAPQHLGLPGTSGGQAWHLNSTCLNTVATSQLDGDWKEGLGEMILLLVKAQVEAIISPFEGDFLMLPLCSPQPKQHLP